MECAHEGCAREATHAPQICIPALGYPTDERRALRILAGIKLCRDHARAFDAMSYLVTQNEDGGTPRELIEEMLRLRGRVPPDWARAWPVPIRLDNPDFVAFERESGGHTLQ